jgi:DNA replication protein DnaC
MKQYKNIFAYKKDDVVLASAIIDRLVHHSYIFKIDGNSYRIKGLQTVKNNKL